MITKKNTSAHRRTHTALVPAPSAYHHLNALLQTMHCIAQYQDTLCELSHEMKRTGVLSPEISNQLRDIFEKIPSHDYVVDLDTIKAALSEPHTLPESVARKPARTAPIRKKSAIVKKKSGRKSSK